MKFVVLSVVIQENVHLISSVRLVCMGCHEKVGFFLQELSICRLRCCMDVNTFDRVPETLDRFPVM